jgi:hypothetical protein
MVWFTMQSMGWTQYATLGLVGALLPWLNIKELAERNEPHRWGEQEEEEEEAAAALGSLQSLVWHQQIIGIGLSICICMGAHCTALQRGGH